MVHTTTTLRFNNHIKSKPGNGCHSPFFYLTMIRTGFIVGCCLWMNAVLAQRNPVVLVHGFLASGDTWAGQYQRFRDAGYRDEEIVCYDWNSLGMGMKPSRADSLLDQCIQTVLKRNNAAQVDLIGHSAGGGLCYRYLKDSVHASRVAHYIHVGSSPLLRPAGPSGTVPTVTISSKGDYISGEQLPSQHIHHVRLKNADHLEVAACAESFDSLYRFIQPLLQRKTDSLLPARPTVVRGRVVTLGENVPLALEPVQVYRFDPESGKRFSDSAFRVLVTDSLGYWPPFEVPDGTYLEWVVSPKGSRPVHYFFEPAGKEHLIYVRTLPASGFLAGMFRQLPAKPDQSVLAVYSSQHALISGRDAVRVNNWLLTDPVKAPANKTIITSFVYDDGDGVTNNQPIGRFGNGIFINAVDVLLPAGNGQTIDIQFNGRHMRLPALPSEAALEVAVFY